MKQKIKKILFTAGIVTMGLIGIKEGVDGIKEDDAIVKINLAMDVLGQINDALATDTLAAEERHGLILSRENIENEIAGYIKRLPANKRAKLMPQWTVPHISDVAFDKELQR